MEEGLVSLVASDRKKPSIIGGSGPSHSNSDPTHCG